MTFDNDKKTALAKEDKSKKGSVDERVVPLLAIINAHPDYYTTSSCSGRVYLWRGSGKKNETEWLNISHDPIADEFFALETAISGFVWLRLEPFILHVACRNLAAARELLLLSRKQYKKSCLLSVGKKIIVEIRGSEFVEMPLYQDGKMLFVGDFAFLTTLINEKLQQIFAGMERFQLMIECTELSTQSRTGGENLPPVVGESSGTRRGKPFCAERLHLSCTPKEPPRAKRASHRSAQR